MKIRESVLTHIESNLFTKCLNSSITLIDKDIIATMEDAIKYLEKIEGDTICAKINLKIPRIRAKLYKN